MIRAYPPMLCCPPSPTQVAPMALAAWGIGTAAAASASGFHANLAIAALKSRTLNTPRSPLDHLVGASPLPRVGPRVCMTGVGPRVCMTGVGGASPLPRVGPRVVTAWASVSPAGSTVSAAPRGSARDSPAPSRCEQSRSSSGLCEGLWRELHWRLSSTMTNVRWLH